MKLTKAAEKYLAAMRRGEKVDITYGPYSQLIEAGLITGDQQSPRLVEKVRP